MSLGASTFYYAGQTLGFDTAANLLASTTDEGRIAWASDTNDLYVRGQSTWLKLANQSDAPTFTGTATFSGALASPGAGGATSFKAGASAASAGATSTAVGVSASASGTSSTAIGNGTVASAANAVAIGKGASSAVASRMRLGGTTTDLVNVSIGGGLGIFESAPVTVQPVAIASPTGGATTDAECRTAVTAVLVALRAYGIIAT